MSGFTYVAGSATPTDAAGLIEWVDAGIRFGSDGSFRSLIVPPLFSTAPLRVGNSPLPGDGGYVADPKFDVWEFDINGWLLVDDTADIPEDVQSAFEYLRDRVNAYKGWQTVELLGLGWAARRQMRLRVAGQIVADVPGKGDLMVPERDLTIPVIAADPRMYEATPTTVRLNGDLVNNGNAPTPLSVTFTATTTWVNPQINGPGAAGSNRIRLGRTLAAGESVTVNTYDADSGALTAVDNTGANAYGDLTAATARVVNPGTEAWTVTQDSGTGTADVTIRGAWG